MKKLLLLAGTTILMAACADAPTSPQRPAPSGRAAADFSCASGYIIAYDENGNPYCAPDPDANVHSQAIGYRIP